MQEMNCMKERSAVRMAPWGPYPTAPLETDTMMVDMEDMEVEATGMVHLIEICHDECFAYYHCDLSNNYVMASVIFRCVVPCTDVMSCVELLCVTYVLPLILFLITFCLSYVYNYFQKNCTAIGPLSQGRA